MRKFRFGFLLMTVSLALAPLAAIAGQAGTPQTATEKAQIEAALSSDKAAQPQDTKPAPATAPKPEVKKAPVKRTEPIIPAFQTPKEKTAVIVFYVWLWLSIGVLIYFLRWWVQEADRVFRAKYYEPAESPRKDNPLPPYLGE
jgi:hypothetical protein